MINLPYDVPVPNGESKKEFTQRITFSLNKWLNTYEETLLFVGHGFIWGLLLQIMGLPICNPDGIPIADLENCSLIHFYHNSREWGVKYL